MNKKIITQVVAVILFLFILITTLITVFSSVIARNLAFLSYRYYIMETDSHPIAAQKGDLVVAKRVKIGEIKQGDHIVYGSGEIYFCDEITELKQQNTITKVITAERNGVKYQFLESDISGKVVNKIYRLGRIIKFLRTPVGKVIFILFVVCVFSLLRILATFYKEDYEYPKKKEGKKEEAKKQEKKEVAKSNK